MDKRIMPSRNKLIGLAARWLLHTGLPSFSCHLGHPLCLRKKNALHSSYLDRLVFSFGFKPWRILGLDVTRYLLIFAWTLHRWHSFIFFWFLHEVLLPHLVPLILWRDLVKIRCLTFVVCFILFCFGLTLFSLYHACCFLYWKILIGFKLATEDKQDGQTYETWI